MIKFDQKRVLKLHCPLPFFLAEGGSATFCSTLWVFSFNFCFCFLNRIITQSWPCSGIIYLYVKSLGVCLLPNTSSKYLTYKKGDFCMYIFRVTLVCHPLVIFPKSIPPMDDPLLGLWKAFIPDNMFCCISSRS